MIADSDLASFCVDYIRLDTTCLLHYRKKVSVTCDPGNYAKIIFFKVIFWKMASRSYNAVQVLDLLDADSSDSGSSGEKGGDI